MVKSIQNLLKNERTEVSLFGLSSFLPNTGQYRPVHSWLIEGPDIQGGVSGMLSLNTYSVWGILKKTLITNNSHSLLVILVYNYWTLSEN